MEKNHILKILYVERGEVNLFLDFKTWLVSAREYYKQKYCYCGSWTPHSLLKCYCISFHIESCFSITMESKKQVNHHIYGQQNTFHFPEGSPLLSSRRRVPWGKLWVYNPSWPHFPPAPESTFSLESLKNLEQKLKRRKECEFDIWFHFFKFQRLTL